MKTFPITHYEFILNQPERFLGMTYNEFINIMGGQDFDFLAFKEKAQELPLVKSTFEYGGASQGNLTVRMMHHMLSLKTFGEKIYYIDRDVCNLLLDTKLTIDAEFLEAPFREIYLYTDQDHYHIQDNDGRYPMKGVYINLHTESDGQKKIRFLATTGAMGVESLKDVNYFACFHIPEKGSLEEACDRQIKGYEEKFDNDGYQIRDNDLHDIFKFCVNALIYIQCKNANLTGVVPQNFQEVIRGKKSPKKIRKIKAKVGKAAQLPFIYVGHNWGKNEDREAVRTNRKLDHEVLVAGHWRGQWKGAVDSPQRRKEIIRIASYVKGRGKEKVNKPYLVK